MEYSNPINNIISIIDETKNNIDISNLKLEYSSSKYSAKKNKIWHISINNKYLTRSNTYTINYKCINCQVISSISIIQLLRRIQSNKNCYLCRNKDINKRNNQSKLMLGNKYAEGIQVLPIIKEPLPSLIEQKIESLKIFEDNDDEFKKNYFSFHLTNEEYNKIKPSLISFNNDKNKEINKYEYWPIFKINNQMKFTSMLYNNETNEIFNTSQPILKCKNCNKNWRAKLLEKFKKSFKILCKDCSLVNNIFKIRKFKNYNNELILYQSKLELKFIEWCNQNKIIIINGPNIPYFFNNKDRIYRVDFQIKTTLIEIKDDHIWHKNDLKSGKWESKEKAVYELIKEGKYDNYYLIKPNNWDEYMNKINKI